MDILKKEFLNTYFDELIDLDKKVQHPKDVRTKNQLWKLYKTDSFFRMDTNEQYYTYLKNSQDAN